MSDVLVNSKKICVSCPEHVAVVGGGRWARVLLEVLCSLVPPSVKISAHSLHNANAMSAWVSVRGLEHRIQVYSDYPKAVSGKSGAVIVANAAHDHDKAIEWALSECLPVLVEKPVTLSSAATHRMADLATSKNIYLAAANVFLFASYVESFSKLVSEGGGVQSIRVHWVDPRSESRYGEVKSYDPGVTVYADWMPHIVSILNLLSPYSTQALQKLEVLRGGAHVKMDILLGKTPCEIELVRNGNGRQRLIEVTTRQGRISLDFSKEPGTIVSGATSQCGDPAWESGPKPVYKMLRAFLQGAAGKVRDERLDIRIGFLANQLIDQLSPAYHSELSSWLSVKYLVQWVGEDADLRYALTEILCADDPGSSVPTEQRIEYLYKHLIDSVISPLHEGFKNHPMKYIGLILNQGKLALFL